MSLMSGVQSLVDGYMWTWTIADRRVDGWLLMSSFKPILFLIILYLSFTIYGPKLMNSHKPFNLNGILFVYNTAVAMLNLYIVKELVIMCYHKSYNSLCEPVRNSTDPEEMRIVNALHMYFVSKLIEFLDTVFIVVRKKNQQLTFLHVYHHSTMFFFVWIGMRWVPGGSAVYGAIINSFVHVLMYSYYGLSVFGPNVVKYLWWKRYLTILQLAQFVLGLTLGINSFMVDCPFPTWMHYTNVLYMISYIVLFGRFYKRSYTASKKSKEEKSCKLNTKEKSTNGVHHQKTQ